jgi:hypothetical protein
MSRSKTKDNPEPGGFFCAACSEKLHHDFENPFRPRQYHDKWYCFDCWNELAHNEVNLAHLHTAKLYSPGRGCPLERPSNEDPSPWEENNVRIMEDES